MYSDIILKTIQEIVLKVNNFTDNILSKILLTLEATEKDLQTADSKLIEIYKNSKAITTIKVLTNINMEDNLYDIRISVENY